MKKTIVMWVVGGVVTASAMALGFTSAVNAAEKEAELPAAHYGMMMHSEKGKMDSCCTTDKMKSEDMQKHFLEMMKSPEMQGHMKEMMKNPEMREQMKEILQENQ